MILLEKVIPKDDFTLELYFKNGDLRNFDMKPYLKYEAFEELKDVNIFKNFEVDELGGIDWLQGGSLSYDTLLNNSVLVNLKEN